MTICRMTRLSSATRIFTGAPRSLGRCSREGTARRRSGVGRATGRRRGRCRPRGRRGGGRGGGGGQGGGAPGGRPRRGRATRRVAASRPAGGVAATSGRPRTDGPGRTALTLPPPPLARAPRGARGRAPAAAAGACGGGGRRGRAAGRGGCGGGGEGGLDVAGRRVGERAEGGADVRVLEHGRGV